MNVNPRGIQRQGLAGDPKSFDWTAKYGSVSMVGFPQYAKLTMDGMNEVGLCVQALSATDGQYEKRDPSRPGMSYLLWVQYYLDTCKTVQEAVNRAKDFQVVPVDVRGKSDWGLHLALADSSGDSAIFEFNGGKLNVYHGKQYQVVTNDPSYEEQMANLKKYKTFGGDEPLPGDISSESRFVRLSYFLKTMPEPKDTQQAIASAFSLIRTVTTPFGAKEADGVVWTTYWFTVADLTNLTYYFQATTSPYLIWVNLKELPLDEGLPIRSISAYDPDLSGNISSLLAKQPSLQQ